MPITKKQKVLELVRTQGVLRPRDLDQYKIARLKDCRRKKAATTDELWEAAKVCRMSKVMKPYMEAVV